MSGPGGTHSFPHRLRPHFSRLYPCHTRGNHPGSQAVSGVNHGGGLAFGEVPLDCYKGIDNLYFDTAIASITFTPEAYRRIIDCYGPHRFLFGTDNPWRDGAKDLAFFNQVSLSEEAGALIFEGNARSIFHI
ncbi:MAG: amidohydrolase family protein [Eubacterium aggregans]